VNLTAPAATRADLVASTKVTVGGIEATVTDAAADHVTFVVPAPAGGRWPGAAQDVLVKTNSNNEDTLKGGLAIAGAAPRVDVVDPDPISAAASQLIVRGRWFLSAAPATDAEAERPDVSLVVAGVALACPSSALPRRRSGTTSSSSRCPRTSAGWSRPASGRARSRSSARRTRPARGTTSRSGRRAPARSDTAHRTRCVRTAIDQLHATRLDKAAQGCLLGVMPAARQAAEVGIEDAILSKATPQKAMDDAAQATHPQIDQYNQAVGIR
jgi:hypothetical protein